MALEPLVVYYRDRGHSTLWTEIPIKRVCRCVSVPALGWERLANMAKRKLGIHSLIFDNDEVIQLLRAAIEREGSQNAFAKRHGIDRNPSQSDLEREKIRQ